MSTSSAGGPPDHVGADAARGQLGTCGQAGELADDGPGDLPGIGAGQRAQPGGTVAGLRLAGGSGRPRCRSARSCSLTSPASSPARDRASRGPGRSARRAPSAVEGRGTPFGQARSATAAADRRRPRPAVASRHRGSPPAPRRRRRSPAAPGGRGGRAASRPRRSAPASPSASGPARWWRCSVQSTQQRTADRPAGTGTPSPASAVAAGVGEAVGAVARGARPGSWSPARSSGRRCRRSPRSRHARAGRR